MTLVAPSACDQADEELASIRHGSEVVEVGIVQTELADDRDEERLLPAELDRRRGCGHRPPSRNQAPAATASAMSAASKQTSATVRAVSSLLGMNISVSESCCVP